MNFDIDSFEFARPTPASKNILSKLDHDDWVWQRKRDGDRRLIVINGGKFITYSKNKKVAEMCGINGKDLDLVLDAEMIPYTDRKWTYAVFDCLWANGKSLILLPLLKRLTYIQSTYFGLSPYFAILCEPTVGVTNNTIDKYNHYKESGGEGFVIKHRSKPYISGRTPFWKKIKD